MSKYFIVNSPLTSSAKVPSFYQVVFGVNEEGSVTMRTSDNIYTLGGGSIEPQEPVTLVGNLVKPTETGYDISLPSAIRHTTQNSGVLTQGTWTNFNFIYDKNNGIPNYESGTNPAKYMTEIGRVDSTTEEDSFTYIKNTKANQSQHTDIVEPSGEIHIYQNGDIVKVHNPGPQGIKSLFISYFELPEGESLGDYSNILSNGTIAFDGLNSHLKTPNGWVSLTTLE